MFHAELGVSTRAARVFCMFLAALLVPGLMSLASAGALEDYVNRPDDAYQWKARNTTNLPTGHSLTHLEMTSQTWRDGAWTHQMQVVRPAKVRNPGIAFLFITGDGSGRSSLEMLRVLADRAGAVAAVITRVPNQPLYDGRKEDALIAFTFDQYLKTGDTSWPLLFPMVKSAVRGMDTVQALAKEQHGQRIEKFVVGGASKRGWTTWLTAAADARVTAIAPMVIDMLNMKAQTEWSEKVYGKQSEQIGDYTTLELHKRMDEPRMVELRGWVDPYSYRQRYTLPKLLLLGTNDPYWTVDALRHYWDELPGPKLVFQTPNAGHDLGDRRDATATLAAFFEMIADGQPLPTMEWKFKNGADRAEVDVTLSQPAKGIRLFSSESEDRDFRDETWVSRPLQEEHSRRAVGHVRVPDKGYRAFLAEATLTSPRGHDYKLSTEARVAPDGVR